MITYNVKDRKFSTGQGPTGVYGQMSLYSLEKMLVSVGRIREDETITHFNILENGIIEYRVERVKYDN